MSKAQSWFLIFKKPSVKDKIIISSPSNREFQINFWKREKSLIIQLFFVSAPEFWQRFWVSSEGVSKLIPLAELTEILNKILQKEELAFKSTSWRLYSDLTSILFGWNLSRLLFKDHEFYFTLFYFIYSYLIEFYYIWIFKLFIFSEVYKCIHKV